MAAIVLAVIGGQYVEIQHLKTANAELDSQYEHQRTDAAMAATRASEAARTLEQQRLAKQQDIQHEAESQVARARSDAAAANAAAGGLRDRYAAALAALRQAGGNPRADASGSAAGDPAALLADVQRRIDEAAGQLAATADERGAAGLACEREYDALK